MKIRLNSTPSSKEPSPITPPVILHLSPEVIACAEKQREDCLREQRRKEDALRADEEEEAQREEQRQSGARLHESVALRQLANARIEEERAARTKADEAHTREEEIRRQRLGERESVSVGAGGKTGGSKAKENAEDEDEKGGSTPSTFISFFRRFFAPRG